MCSVGHSGDLSRLPDPVGQLFYVSIALEAGWQGSPCAVLWCGVFNGGPAGRSVSRAGGPRIACDADVFL